MSKTLSVLPGRGNTCATDGSIRLEGRALLVRSFQHQLICNLPPSLWSQSGLETKSQILTGDRSGATDGRDQLPNVYAKVFAVISSRACEQLMRLAVDYILLVLQRMQGVSSSTNLYFSFNVTQTELAKMVLQVFQQTAFILLTGSTAEGGLC